MLLGKSELSLIEVALRAILELRGHDAKCTSDLVNEIPEAYLDFQASLPSEKFALL